VSGWRRAAYRAVRPLLFLADPEAVHHLALRLLATPVGVALAPAASGARQPAEPIEVLGLRFRNRVGLAAGFDKDGLAIAGWAALGFGFIELGTVTPRPQPGNDRPRLFRLSRDEALVNRMGFNNAGAEALAERIAAVRRDLPAGFVIGVNIGRNRDGGLDDYAVAARAVGAVADYLAINVSSPNTPGLREHQRPEALDRILDSVTGVAPDRPVLVKLSPDLPDADRSALLDHLARSPAAGVIASNTTLTRTGLRSSRATEVGGVSGRPLLSGTLHAVHQAAGHGLTVIGSGGIASGADAGAVLEAGADLAQLWTGMIYAGPALIGEVVAATRGAK
jgi:dihydroorotate dehydrogenase